MAGPDEELALRDQCDCAGFLESAPPDAHHAVAHTRSPMNKAKAAALIQEQFDRQARESFGNVTMPVPPTPVTMML